MIQTPAVEQTRAVIAEIVSLYPSRNHREKINVNNDEELDIAVLLLTDMYLRLTL
jgi:hypothetical protein